MNKIWIILMMVLVSLGILIAGTFQQPAPTSEPTRHLKQLLASETEGFASVNPGRPYDFPNDYLSHPDFRSDIWYFTGHLGTEQGQEFGFQMTFLRFALAPQKPDIESAWAFNNAYRAHIAITDVGHQQFHASEKYSRAALGLAGVTHAPVRVWLDQWEMRMPDPTQSQFQLRAKTDKTSLTLDLESVKTAVTNIVAGAGNPAANGYWLPRLRAIGELQSNGVTYQVRGTATLSQIWGDMTLPGSQLTYNRFVLQLDDQRELLVVQLRRRDGSREPISTGLLVEANGASRRLRRQELMMSALDHWRSPMSGAFYPSRWQLQIPAENIALEISPMVDDQELNLSMRYWSGLVHVAGVSNRRAVSGTGQVELMP